MYARPMQQRRPGPSLGCGGGSRLGDPSPGDPDPSNGDAYRWSSIDEAYVRFEPSIGQNVTAAWDQARASYPENPFANMTELQKAQYYAGKYGVAAASQLQLVAGGTTTPEEATAAAQNFLSANATEIKQVVAAVDAAQQASLAARSYANDYLAQSGGSLDKWYQLSNPGAPRYTLASNGGALLDNALLQYIALKSAGADLSAIDKDAAAAQAAQDAAFEASKQTGGFTSGMVPPKTAQAAVQAVIDAGGDPQQWTSVVDQQSGTTLGLVRQGADGSVLMAPANNSSASLASVANSVTGFIDRAAGTITDIGTQVAKVGNAIKGAEAGATAGYNASDLKKYALIGGGVLALAYIVANSRPSRRR
jgi:hypothetical protein